MSAKESRLSGNTRPKRGLKDSWRRDARRDPKEGAETGCPTRLEAQGQAILKGEEERKATSSTHQTQAEGEDMGIVNLGTPASSS